MQRLLPSRPLPPYAFVPGQTPPPPRNPARPSFGPRAPKVPPLVPEQWQHCEAYLFGVDLFNHGFYWEAHEAWELLWVAAGREGVVAELLQGLIKLAAGSLKLRQALGRAAHTLACEAQVHFATVTQVADADPYAGFHMIDLVTCAQQIIDRAAQPAPTGVSAAAPPTPLIDAVLHPE